jgi:probable rRNA maturation factor
MSARLSGPARRRGLPRPDRRLLRARAARLLRELECAGAALSIRLADDAEMAALNGAWRGRPRPTDVLAFSLLEGPGARHRGALLGDVVIGVEAAARQARGARRPLDDEIARLLIHGALHLLGHDHRAAGEARRMRAEERRLWRALRGAP